MLLALAQESAQLTKPEWQNCVRTRALEAQLQESTPDAMKTCQGCSKLYLQAPLVRLLAQARSNIDAVWARHGPSTCVLLDGGNLFWASNLPGSANLGALAAASLRFPPHIEAIADKVAKAIGAVYNGVHLRWDFAARVHLQTNCVAVHLHGQEMPAHFSPEMPAQSLCCPTTCQAAPAPARPPAIPLHARLLAFCLSQASWPWVQNRAGHGAGPKGGATRQMSWFRTCQLDVQLCVLQPHDAS